MSISYKKLWNDYEYFDVPTSEIKINGTKLDTVKDCCLSEAVITLSCKKEANSAAITISAKLAESGLDSLLQIGAKTEVSFGYGKKTALVFCGYLHELTIIKDKAEIKYQLFCLDCKGLMALGSSAKRAEKKKLSAVINEIVGQYSGFYSKKTIDAIPDAFDLPAAIIEESNYDFLCKWAEILGFYFYLDADKLFFVSNADTPSAPELELALENGVVSSQISASLSNQVKKITLVSFDDDGKRIAVSENRPSEKGIAKDKLSSVLGAEKTFLYPSFKTKNHLEFMKKPRMKEIHGEYCKIEAVCIGLPELSPLGKLKFDDKTWRITQAIHRFDKNGYETEINASAE